MRPPSVDPTRRVAAAFEPGTGESAEPSAAKTRVGSSSSTAIAWTVTLAPEGKAGSSVKITRSPWSPIGFSTVPFAGSGRTMRQVLPASSLR